MESKIDQFYSENFDTLVKRYHNRAGSRPNAEDVVQEAFSRALKYYSTFEESKKEFGAWFNTIANNALRDFKNQEKRMGMSVEFNEEDWGTSLNLDDEMLKESIYTKIAEKPKQQREILKLHFEKQYMAKEIAEQMDVPHRTVVTTVVRFSKEIKDWYDASMRS